jgi:hypothetical protein
MYVMGMTHQFYTEIDSVMYYIPIQEFETLLITLTFLRDE